MNELIIAKFCDSCTGSINITDEPFWLRHGRHLTAKDKEKRLIICDGCGHKIITLTKKEQQKDDDERIRQAMEHH